MAHLPLVPFGSSGMEITRLTSGGNPMVGNSHFSDSMNEDMRDYFSITLNVEHTLESCG